MANQTYSQAKGQPQGLYYVSESAALQSGTGSVEIKVESGLLGKPATTGYFINDGPGTAKCNVSYKSGVTSGSVFTLYAGEQYTLRKESVVSSFWYSYSGTSGNFRSFWQ